MFHLFLFVAGLAGLVVGANLLVRGASQLALSFGISPLVVGLTIVALGTSAPEIAVSVAAVASSRLQKMTQGRYSLVHTDGAAKGGARSGLGFLGGGAQLRFGAAAFGDVA